MPETLSAVSAAEGIGAGQRKFEAVTNAGRMRIGRADEFEGIVGYEFDWGLVLPYLPAGFVGDSEVASIAWRVVPVALWGELAARGRLLAPVPTVLGYSTLRSVAFVSHCLQVPRDGRPKHRPGPCAAMTAKADKPRPLRQRGAPND
ncbi:MAG: hypothetical protein IPH26_09560 [Sterolibacteriaceae bacterium]|uniref:Uncharacterized protein n=1 Tax=Candidatus Methylophosphatis roskildensis TaxID=2899263 RepID=A0A9D7DYF8_9PROT|nr:hypothetical protein [Candidatus Methylophosphatis roskildensis]MBK7238255.1 hypothetical protein [Sterolibacteriaceae bacterium]